MEKLAIFNARMLDFTLGNMARRMRHDALFDAAIKNEATVREFQEMTAKLNREMDTAAKAQGRGWPVAM